MTTATAVTSLDKSTLRLIQTDILAAVQAVAAKHGVAITPGGGSFEPMTATVKLSIKVLTADDGRSGDEVNFGKYCQLFGLPADTYGKTFRVRGLDYTVSGLDLKRRARPVIATRDGKTFVFRVEDVCRLLNGGAR